MGRTEEKAVVAYIKPISLYSLGWTKEDNRKRTLTGCFPDRLTTRSPSKYKTCHHVTNMFSVCRQIEQG